MYKFSVLMSVYKKDNPFFLKQAIDSIYDKQTRKPSQVVIVKDGPLTEALDCVLDSYSKKYSEIFKIVSLEKNIGLGPALQEGLAYCKYEIIARMDSDDISDIKRFEKQIEYMEKNPEIDVLGSYISEFEESIEEEMRVRVVPLDFEGIKAMIRRRNPINHVTVCMKKETVRACGGYESVDLLEDYYLWIKIVAQKFDVRNIPLVLVYVRIGKKFSEKRGAKTRITGWRKIQEKLLKNNLITRKEALLNMLLIRIFVYMPTGAREFVYSKILRR
jgi:glycosyltransferase involved in cell wall biosynthesis